MSLPIGLFYGSTTGATETIAKDIEKIAKKSDINIDVHDVSFVNNISDLLKYDKLILGTPTWFYGEHQDDWETLLDLIPTKEDLSHMTVALYGLGDQEGYSDYYLDAMGMIADEFFSRGATIIGKWPNDDSYNFDESKALIDDDKFFVGLALDEDCQYELTEKRLADWLTAVLPELSKK